MKLLKFFWLGILLSALIFCSSPYSFAETSEEMEQKWNDILFFQNFFDIDDSLVFESEYGFSRNKKEFDHDKFLVTYSEEVYRIIYPTPEKFNRINRSKMGGSHSPSINVSQNPDVYLIFPEIMIQNKDGGTTQTLFSLDLATQLFPQVDYSFDFRLNAGHIYPYSDMLCDYRHLESELNILLELGDATVELKIKFSDNSEPEVRLIVYDVFEFWIRRFFRSRYLDTVDGEGFEAGFFKSASHPPGTAKDISGTLKKLAIWNLNDMTVEYVD